MCGSTLSDVTIIGILCKHLDDKRMCVQLHNTT